MALFKVLRGPSSNLNSQPFVDGYAYFTPDDGRFYIDVQSDTAPNYYYSTGVVNGKNIYRIEVESGTMAELNIAKMNRGEALTASLTMTAGTSSFVYDGVTNITIDLQADWNETNTNSPSYIRNKPNIDGTLLGITIDDNAKTMFITSPIENGDEVSY